MAVTLRELLSDAQHKLAQPSGDTRAAARDAVAAFAQIARACDQLDQSRLNDKNASPTSPTDVKALRDAVREASGCWPNARSPIADLGGAAYGDVMSSEDVVDSLPTPSPSCTNG